jgi:hypothetical protein
MLSPPQLTQTFLIMESIRGPPENEAAALMLSVFITVLRHLLFSGRFLYYSVGTQLFCVGQSWRA